MGGFRWIGFVAARYISKKRKDRSNSSMILAVLGIFIGVLALTVILAVMNGFQLGFIESILEISSFHIRLESFPEAERDRFTETTALPGITAILPFLELTGIIRGNWGGQQVAAVRGLPPDALERDAGMARRIDMVRGSFDITGADSILLGVELAWRLDVDVGDELALLSVSGIFPGDASPEDSVFTVRGIFRTEFYEYDLGWAFINLDRAVVLAGKDTLSLGIKLKNRWQDQRIAARLRELPELKDVAGYTIKSWRDYNRAFFGALRTEKLLMFVLVGLIFIVVGLNIFQAQRKAVLERREEIGLLRAVGGSDRAVRLIFVWDGFFIGITGAGLGTLLGLILAFNIGVFFTVLETLVNGFIDLLNFISLSLFGSGALGEGGFAFFSPTIFYIKEIPSRVIPHEVLLIFMFGFLSAVLAAWFASRKISLTRPAEVLRYE
ncbi:MAG: ABC transporter permease [Spirochaetaceae bacterium]|jgi:lipoprotein-releasing system permease protein|nr:ABC transporter permease [Spirochaetaceae bacterium]